MPPQSRCPRKRFMTGWKIRRQTKSRQSASAWYIMSPPICSTLELRRLWHCWTGQRTSESMHGLYFHFIWLPPVLTCAHYRTPVSFWEMISVNRNTSMGRTMARLTNNSNYPSLPNFIRLRICSIWLRFEASPSQIKKLSFRFDNDNQLLFYQMYLRFCIWYVPENYQNLLWRWDALAGSSF